MKPSVKKLMEGFASLVYQFEYAKLKILSTVWTISSIKLKSKTKKPNKEEFIMEETLTLTQEWDNTKLQ